MRESNVNRISVLVLFVVFLSLAVVEAYGADGYKIGPKDVISVAVFAGGEEQVAVDLTVSNDGTVNFPFLGTVKAEGISISQLEEAVVGPLEQDFFVSPQVHIRIKEYQSLNFSISGAVKKPGKYTMQAATKIMDLIAKAEGVTADRGNIAYILRDGAIDGKASGESDQSSEPVKVNLLKLLDSGDMSHNIALVPGDSVYIPLAKGQNQSELKVYVSGKVEKPDLYEYQPGLTVLSLCIMAGGFDKYAAPNRTTIVRLENGEQKVIKIDLEDVIKGDIPDVPLLPGDRVHVPESWL
ncbi:polysaccharide biosynthesis/export family protein [Desulforhopalus sp. 52FAK]